MSQDQGPRAASQVPRSAWATLGIFITLYLLSFFDRQILSLLLIPIQKDLKLSDVQLGLVTGIAFALFYATVGLALGWAIDRYSKKWLLFGGVVLWSLSTVACGLASNFGGLFAARVIVGFGEAVVAPAAMVVLPSIFPRERLGFVMGIYYGASNIGAAIVFVGGGAMVTALTAAGGLTLPFVGALAPWQATFVLLGLPGLLLAFLAFLIVEPARAGKADIPGDHPGEMTLAAFLRQNRRILVIHFFAFALACMGAYCAIAWAPTYLGRSYGWTPLKIGLAVGISNGFFGLAGNLLWGAIADRFVRRGHTDGVYIAYMVAIPLGLPIALATFLVHDAAVAIIGICGTWLVLLSTGPMNAVLGVFVPVYLRARVSALTNLGVAVLAIGLTPLLVGGVTEYVFRDRLMVGASIATVMTICSAGAFAFLWFGRKPLRAAIARNDVRDGLMMR